MAEFKFNCPGCRQSIQVDELWSGHQLECPTCHAQITVPPSPAAAAPAARPAVQARVTAHAPAPAARGGVAPPPVPAGPAKLAIGTPKAEAHGDAPKAGPVIRDMVGPPPKKKSKLMSALATILVIGALGAGGYFGYDYWQKQKAAKEAEAARQAEAAAEAARQAAAAKAPPPPKELPIIAPTYTLDISQARIPEGKANGTLAGTNFVVEAAKVDKVGGTYVLSLRQGTGPSPDREILVFLHLKPTDGPTNQNLTVTADAKNPLVSQVAKLWKKDPRYAPQRKDFFTGYVMKLELGQLTDSGIAGKIYLALNDKEESVVGGLFKANMGQVIDVTTQAPVETPRQRSNPEFEKRYGAPRRN